jgi:hypothetical protein
VAPGIESRLSCPLVTVQASTGQPLVLPFSSEKERFSGTSKAFFTAMHLLDFRTSFSFSEAQELVGHYLLWMNIGGRWTRVSLDRSKRP